MEALPHMYSIVTRLKVGGRIHQINKTEAISTGVFCFLFFFNITLNMHYFANNVANVKKVLFAKKREKIF